MLLLACIIVFVLTLVSSLTIGKDAADPKLMIRHIVLMSSIVKVHTL
jgi:hypothetical protein